MDVWGDVHGRCILGRRSGVGETGKQYRGVSRNDGLIGCDFAGQKGRADDFPPVFPVGGVGSGTKDASLLSVGIATKVVEISLLDSPVEAVDGLES